MGIFSKDESLSYGQLQELQSKYEKLEKENQKLRNQISKLVDKIWELEEITQGGQFEHY